MGNLKVNGDITANNFLGNLKGVATYATLDSVHGGEIFSSRSTGDSVSLNDFNRAGSYRMGIAMGNAPSHGVDYGQLLVLRGSSWSDTLTQVAFPCNRQDIYFRNSAVTTLSSKAWTQVLTNQNYTSYCASASHSHNYLPLTGGIASGSVWASTSSGSEIQMGISNTGGKLYFYGSSKGCGIYSSAGGGVIYVSSTGDKTLYGRMVTTNNGSTLPSSGYAGEVYFKIV